MVDVTWSDSRDLSWTLWKVLKQQRKCNIAVKSSQSNHNVDICIFRALYFATLYFIFDHSPTLISIVDWYQRTSPESTFTGDLRRLIINAKENLLASLLFCLIIFIRHKPYILLILLGKILLKLDGILWKAT